MALTALFSPPPPARFGAGSRQRAGALILAIVLHLLVFMLLLLQRAIPIPVKMEQRLNAFMLMPDKKEEGQKDKALTKPKVSKATKGKSDAAQTKPVTPPPPPPQTPPAVTSNNKLPFILMTSQDFAASDISHMESHKAPAAPGQDSRADYGPGEGPGGATLYNADWFRKPSNVELNGYLPANAPRTGWGLIACKTIAHYHVEDCITLGESPPGSGFARAVRDAAWQFLILPPRINGRAMVGTWVRIRITYTDGAADGPG